MIANHAKIYPKRVAAILYRPEQDADTLLADFTQDLARQGVRVGGIVQRNFKGANGMKTMLARDVATGREIPSCQPLGSGAISCKLDANGLADAAVVASRAIKRHVDLLVINKFSKQEASGRGLRDEFC
ncbi:DUF2478 domain-containing protein [Bradyrhizobium sp. sBnM-33]|uniref:DUF2478 domain-containing protein n=1 Tax=Bradyrhizobium sp. sBnM-33 TaxID=2831780 RepID=UPI0020BF1644|nr:DUF2478 domain-containing protein [Bradyrhizobium sp. sBnM-33]WOH52387.1 DUF2478 domain-containing protein [Bradyrhizobium sp. sBnM-33]